jgi:hypothetical protein
MAGVLGSKRFLLKKFLARVSLERGARLETAPLALAYRGSAAEIAPPEQKRFFKTKNVLKRFILYHVAF